jgi:primase-polymerase (primpol)-like protein
MSNNPEPAVTQPAVPDALIGYRQFVTWRLIPQPNGAKPRKVPYNPITGYQASTTDPTTWADYATALGAVSRGEYAGVGFVFTPDDPFVFIDLDHCRDPATGAYQSHAVNTFGLLSGAWEISQSGTGLHGVGIVTDAARFADKRRKWTDASGNAYEVYLADRFMAIGGTGWTGEPDTDWTESLASLVPAKESLSDYKAVEWLDRARDGYDGPADDNDLLQRAMASQGPLTRLGVKASFADLWNADPVALGALWPDDTRQFDHSSADLALCNALAWWTGCNPARMERLFARSALWRDDTRKARLAIAKAINDPNRSHFSRAQRLRDDERIGDDIAADAFPEILTLEESIADLVFIGEGSLVVSRRSKRVRSKADAVNEWAASKFTVDTGRFDNSGHPVTKDVPVIRAWNESRDRRSRDVLAWVPGEPEFCASPERQQSGDRAYNLWVPPILMTPPVDWQDRVQAFVQHIAYLIPDETERRMFTQWLGHIFQRPGELPHTAYLMFTPKTGTGRGTLGSILTRALRGYVAANVSGDTLFGNFNGRLSMKLLATVDEIREGNGASRYANEQKLRSAVTEEYRHINKKYGSQSVEKNCCRWLMFSNHADALPFDNSDRRIVVIENPSQCETGEYYARLHDALHDPLFIASVQHFLMTLDLRGFNPHAHAPMNAAKMKALASLASDADRAAKRFADEWPTDFATRRDFDSYLGDDRPTGRNAAHIMERAGITSTGVRVIIGGKRESVIVVHGKWTADDVSVIDKTVLIDAITVGRGVVGNPATL